MLQRIADLIGSQWRQLDVRNREDSFRALLQLPNVREAEIQSIESGPLMLAGALLAYGMPQRWRQHVEPWNSLGMSGLVMLAALVLAVLMIPPRPDRCTRRRAETGGVARLRSRAGVVVAPTGLVVQGFFLGNMLPMTAVAGSLYLDAPLRVCNAYRIDEQQQVGVAFIGLAATVAVVWLVLAGWTLVREK